MRMSEEKRIKRQIETELRRNTGLDFDVFCFDLIDSTNTEARRYTLSGGSAPAVFIAREQSAGRGRMGRSFYSPKATGLYLSVLLDIQSDDAVRLTTSAAVAARRAVLRTANTVCSSAETSAETETILWELRSATSLSGYCI